MHALLHEDLRDQQRRNYNHELGLLDLYRRAYESALAQGKISQTEHTRCDQFESDALSYLARSMGGALVYCSRVQNVSHSSASVFHFSGSALSPTSFNRTFGHIHSTSQAITKLPKCTLTLF